MALGVGVEDRVVVKRYASAVMASAAKAVSSSDLVATGGKILRRVSVNMDLNKDTYQSQEMLSHLQVVDFRHGAERAQGSITGELSCGTYFDEFEAACRHTKISGIAKSNTEFTSIAGDAAGSKFTVAASNPVTEGLRTGHILRLTNTDAGAINRNYYVTGFSAASNRDILVTPAPPTFGADTSFNLTTQGATGKSVYLPAQSGQVKYKYGVEVWNSGLDLARLFTECRIAGFSVQAPPQGMATIEFNFLGRGMETFSAGSAPFFSGPTAESTTGLLAGVNGSLVVNGTVVGVVTGLNFSLNVQSSAPVVLGQVFTPDVLLGRAVVSGQITAFFQDFTMLDYFRNETEIGLLVVLTATSAANSPAITFWMPRIKLGAAQLPSQGELEQGITMPFQALMYNAVAEATGGTVNTTLQICDTEGA